MNLIHKLKETCIAVLPIALLVCILTLTIAPVDPALLPSFVAGTFLIITGLSFFLTGADIGIMPAGSFLGGSLTRTRKLPLILTAGFVVGFLITIAEPDLLVLGRQVECVTGAISAQTMVIAVAMGIGLFVTIALARTIFQFSFQTLIIIGYLLVFALASQVSPVFVAIAFDSGGATTGPMTVPFIIALGVGIASVRGDKTSAEDSFGYTGIASIGPILAVTILGFILAGKSGIIPHNTIQSLTETNGIIPIYPGLLDQYSHEFPLIMKNVAVALGPLVAILFLFQIFLLKLPPKQIHRIIAGFVYAYIGLVLFFLGTDTAFIPMGRALGASLGALSYKEILIPIGCLLGAVVVCAEPAIWVLTEQVEEISGGNIRKPVMLTALAIGVASSVGLSMARVIYGFSIWYLLLPFYTAAILLTFVTPKLFTAIAFDSGGVASGPMSSTFILSLTLGASAAVGGNPATDAFGLIAMIAVTPLVSIQILGWLFTRRENHALHSGGTQ